MSTRTAVYGETGSPSICNVRAIELVALPAHTLSADGNTLTASGVGALTVDTVGVAVNDRICNVPAVASVRAGIYSVTNPGSGIAAWVLDRVEELEYGMNAARGFLVYVAGGTVATVMYALEGSASPGVTPVTIGTTALAARLASPVAHGVTNPTTPGAGGPVSDGTTSAGSSHVHTLTDAGHTHGAGLTGGQTSTVDGGTTGNASPAVDGGVSAGATSTVDGGVSAGATSTVDGGVSAGATSTVDGGVSAGAASTVDGGVSAGQGSTVDGGVSAGAASTVDGGTAGSTAATITVGGNADSTTATNSAMTMAGQTHFEAPLAAALTGIVTTVAITNGAGPTVLALAAQPDHPRKLQVRIVDADNTTTGDLTLVGIGARGQVVGQVIPLTGGTRTITTTNAYAILTSATLTTVAGADPIIDTVGIGPSDALGLPGSNFPTATLFSVYKVSAGLTTMTNESAAASDAAEGTFTPTTPTDGATNFDCWFTYNVTPLQTGHTHALTSATATDAGHVHGPGSLTVASHSHGPGSLTVASHTHGPGSLTVASHTHGPGSLSVASHTHGPGSLSVASHTHGPGSLTVASHTHGPGSLAVASHAHSNGSLSVASHTHSIAGAATGATVDGEAAHTHSLAHTHTGAAHTHTF